MITEGTKSTRVSDDEVRRLLDARLGLPLTGEEFAFLVLQGGVAEIQAAAKGSTPAEALLGQATETVRNLRVSQGKPVGEPARRAGEMAIDDRDRRYALSRLLALEAAREPEVVRFRETYLGGKVLAWEEIESWIKGQADADGEHSLYIEVVVPPETQVKPTASGLMLESDVPASELQTEGGVKARFLEHGVRDGKWVKRTPVRAGGVLDELRRLCERLAKSYTWTTDQACVFLLTGIDPYMVGVRLQTEVQSEHPAASRVTMVIDPVVAPLEVLERYSELRQKLLKGTYRPLQEKHLKLAVFAAERRPPAKWSEVMQAWNEAHPEQAYAKETIFARDCTAAQNRLLRPRLDADALL